MLSVSNMFMMGWVMWVLMIPMALMGPADHALLIEKVDCSVYENKTPWLIASARPS